MKLIVAVNNKGYIGKDGKLMWKCSEDLQHFKKLTLNNILIMGRKTYDECLGGNPLPRRFHSVVTSDRDLHERGEHPAVNYGTLSDMVKSSMIALHTSGRADSVDIWVAGGAEIYKQLVYLCDEIHLSVINDNQEGDARFDVPSDYRGEVFIYNFEPDGKTNKSAETDKGDVSNVEVGNSVRVEGL